MSSQNPSNDLWVVSRSKPSVRLLGWAVAAALIAGGVALAREQPWWLLAWAPALALLLSENMERVCVGVDQVVVRRPPLPTLTTAARDIQRIVRETPSQVLIYSRRRRRPVNVRYLGSNAAEFEAALLALASRHEIRVEKSPIYRELSEES